MLTEQVEIALKRPGIYAQTYQNQGDTMSENKTTKLNIQGVSGNVSGVAGGDISGVAGQDIIGAAGRDISGNLNLSILGL